MTEHSTWEIGKAITLGLSRPHESWQKCMRNEVKLLGKKANASSKLIIPNYIKMALVSVGIHFSPKQSRMFIPKPKIFQKLLTHFICWWQNAMKKRSKAQQAKSIPRTITNSLPSSHFRFSASTGSLSTPVYFEWSIWWTDHWDSFINIKIDQQNMIYMYHQSSNPSSRWPRQRGTDHLRSSKNLSFDKYGMEINIWFWNISRRSELPELEKYESLLPSWLAIVRGREDLSKFCHNWLMVLLKVYHLQRDYPM